MPPGRFARCVVPLCSAALAASLQSGAVAADARATSPDATPAGPLAAELGVPLQRHFSSDDYDGFSSVTAVAHTAEGFTLFGTYHAAILYDGVTHEKIPVPATYVTALCRDDAGVMWAGGDNEIGVIETDAADGRLRYVSRTNLLPADARAFGRMRGMVASRAGVFAATSHGVLRFAAGRAEFLPLPPEGNLQLFAIGGRVYLQDSPRGLRVFDAGDFRAIDTGHSLTGRRIQLVERDAAHALCVVEGEGVFNLALATGRLEKIATPLDALLAEPMGRGLRLADGRVVLIRGNNRGLVIADSALRGAQVLDAKTGLTNTAILGAALDADHGLWLATANGLLRLDLAPGVTLFDERNAFPIGSSMSLVRHGGVLYAGTTQGLKRLAPGEPATGKPARFVPDPRVPELCDNLRDTPEGLLFNTNDAVELLTAAGRRRLFDPKSRIAMIKPNRRASGVYFVATDDGGFHVLNLPAGTTRRVLTLPPGVMLWNGAEESDRVSWFGTAASGFWRIAAPDGKWSEAMAEAQPLGQSGLPEGKSWTGVFSLFDELHFLTETGMYRREAATGKFSSDDRFRIEGVNPLRFMPVVPDTTGRAWTSPWLGTLACARPLGYFQAARPDTGERARASSFTWNDAPARWQAGVGRFGAGLILVESEGGRPVLWTKSPTAIARIELDTLPANHAGAPWRPVLRRFMIGEQTWPMARGGAGLRLPFSNQPITLRYAAPRYRPGAPVRYQTRLLGFRDEWSALAPSNETVFTNLTGGPFTFEVRGIDADGIVSETARLIFSVAPPWRRSAPAIAVYVVALAGAMTGFIRWRLRHAERERTRLEKLVAQRTDELRLAKNAADDANRAKSVFLANMSHELRTPLNGVIGYAQVLMKSSRVSGDDRERLRIIQASGGHLLQMINEVLDFSKIEAGKLELQSAPFHLPQLVRDLSASHRPRAEEKGLTFTTTLATDLPEQVRGDAQKLRQVLDNLLGNAVKFTPEGRVELRVERAPAGVLAFSISDTGVGIAEADREKLFQPFHQAADGRPPEPGTGLGLAISQRIVQLMGGALSVQSARGRGTTFTFAVRLDPIAEPRSAADPLDNTIVGYAGERRRLLVVDDLAVNRAVLVELLAPLGFEVREAPDGPAALAFVAEFCPHLVFLDLRMPGMSGFELAAKLRSASAASAGQPKLIAMSASVLSFNRNDAFAAGCDDFLPKPFHERELLERLEQHLGLTWVRSSGGPASTPDRETIAEQPVDSGMLEHLLAAARCGEVARLRELLGTLFATHPRFAAEIDALLRAYRMEELRQLLERRREAIGTK